MHWHRTSSAYVSGHLAFTGYALKIGSDDKTINRLVSSLDAERLALQLEAGHRRPWNERTAFTPRLCLEHAQVKTDGFTDATSAQAPDSDLTLTLEAGWQLGPLVLDAALSAREAGSGNSAYSGALQIGIQF